jgi:hypothetical protein
MRVDFEKTKVDAEIKYEGRTERKMPKMIVPWQWDVDCALGCRVENDGQEAWGRHSPKLQ